MSTLDLTFTGKTLPGHSIGQLKINLARLFCIDDDSVIDSLFSGETIYLRCDLDRRSAADYYREISEMGGKATLISSAERRLDSGAMFLQQCKGKPACLVPLNERTNPKDDGATLDPGGCDQVWAVSKSCQISDHTCADAAQPHVAASTPPLKKFEATRANLILTSTGKELARLESKAAETRAESIREISNLRREHAAQEKAIAEELKQLTQARTELQRKADAALESLWAQEQNLRDAAQSSLEDMTQKHLAQSSNQSDEIARLQTQESEKRETSQAAVEALEEKLSHTRHATQEKIAQLELLLSEAKRQAELDIAALEEELANVRDSAEQEVSGLVQRRTEIAAQQEHTQDQLLSNEAAVRNDMEAGAAALRAQQEEIRTGLARDLAELDQQVTDIIQRGEETEAAMENTCAELRERTEEALLKLRELEEMLKERQDRALAELRSASNDGHHGQIAHS